MGKITENINEQKIHQKFVKKERLHKSQLKVIKGSYQDISACFALRMVKMSSCDDAKVDNFLLLFENHFSNQYGPKKCWTNHRNEGIDCCTLRIIEKQSWTFETVGHSKNDYRKRSTLNYKRTGSVGKLKQSGRKKKFTNIGQNALLCLVKVSRRLNLRDITSKFNECKAQTFSKKILGRVLHSQGCKRRWAKKKVVV